ncbi:hypothetical protein E2C01_011861 [Portunus trituberculatus]|uniref:C2H2-type domain-containing protein n=1 Tax=Portunus trituberculatus TaxID=210409 RepID=A0A5B7DC87_PORTR|nr:hypothetical protein [Portunus trituberculatus]
MGLPHITQLTDTPLYAITITTRCLVLAATQREGQYTNETSDVSRETAGTSCFVLPTTTITIAAVTLTHNHNASPQCNEHDRLASTLWLPNISSYPIPPSDPTSTPCLSLQEGAACILPPMVGGSPERCYSASSPQVVACCSGAQEGCDSPRSGCVASSALMPPSGYLDSAWPLAPGLLYPYSSSFMRSYASAATLGSLWTTRSINGPQSKHYSSTLPPSPEKRDEPLNLSLKSCRPAKAAIWSPASALEQEEKEESLPSPTGRLSPMDSSDCEAVQTTHEEPCRDPRAATLDPLSLRLGLRQYADFVVNLQGLATRDKESEGAPVSRDEKFSSPWCPGVWPWAPVYRGNEIFNCQQCPKTFNSPVSLDIHVRRAHSPATKPCDPYPADNDKAATHPPSFTTVSTTRTEKTFQYLRSPLHYFK